MTLWRSGRWQYSCHYNITRVLSHHFKIWLAHCNTPWFYDYAVTECRQMHIWQMLHGMLFWLTNITLGDMQLLFFLVRQERGDFRIDQDSWAEVHDGRKFLKVTSMKAQTWEDGKQEKTGEKAHAFVPFWSFTFLLFAIRLDKAIP